MEDDGYASICQKFIAPSMATVSFAKALNRRVIGSMNELVIAANNSIAIDGTAPRDLASYLNDWLLSAISTPKDRHYGQPKEAFKLLSYRKGTESADG